ncbi:MAG: carboxypeptidase-like regulatory domain-containing protein [Cyanobacteria bacterium J06648_11]
MRTILSVERGILSRRALRTCGVAIAVCLAGSVMSARAQQNTPVRIAPDVESEVETISPATGRLIGQVLDPSGQPIAGVTVRVVLNPYFETGGEDALETATRTDASGAFELLFPLAGRWNLAISHPDYEPLTEEVWAIAGMTSPIDVVLNVPLEKRDRTRMGIVGASGLAHTRPLSQQLATDLLRLRMVPNEASVVLLDNRRLEPVLERVGMPLYELLERDRVDSENVGEFFDYLGLKALVVAKADVLARAADATQVELKSRSVLELWTFDEAGNLKISTLENDSREETLDADLSVAEIEQLLQIQVTKTAQEFGDRWQTENPLASYFDADDILTPQDVRLDTTVRLNLPPDSTETRAPEESSPKP